jgi:hypothetical protein
MGYMQTESTVCTVTFLAHSLHMLDHLKDDEPVHCLVIGHYEEGIHDCFLQQQWGYFQMDTSNYHVEESPSY